MHICNRDQKTNGWYTSTIQMHSYNNTDVPIDGHITMDKQIEHPVLKNGLNWFDCTGPRSKGPETALNHRSLHPNNRI